MKNYNLPIVIEKDADGYFVSCPVLQGCYSQGKTYEDAIKNIEDAIKLHIEDRNDLKESIATPQSVSITMLRFAVE